MEEKGTPLPEEVLDSVRKNKIAIKAPITTPIGSGFRSVNVAIRKKLDLYACLRPYKLYPGVQSNYKKADLVVVRENTEDIYAGAEFEFGTKENEYSIVCPPGIREPSTITFEVNWPVDIQNESLLCYWIHCSR